MKKSIKLELENKIGTLTIVRNERRNSLDNDAIDAFLSALYKVRRSSIVALVVTAEGDRSFCAGSDLKALAHYSAEEAVHHTYLFQLLTETVDELPCATIAAIEGACLGGGLELALSCDYRIASEVSHFGFPELTMGVLPTGGGTVRAPRVIGLGRTREMMLFGESITSRQALDIGLVSALVPSGDVLSSAYVQANKLAETTNRDAVSLLKAMLVTGAGTSPRTGQMMALLGDVALTRSEHFMDASGKFESEKP